MERRAKVELFEEIRREYEFGAGTVSGVARKLGVHRRLHLAVLAPRMFSSLASENPTFQPVHFPGGRSQRLQLSAKATPTSRFRLSPVRRKLTPAADGRSINYSPRSEREPV